MPSFCKRWCQRDQLIAQDVTAYGADRGESDALADLLTDLLPLIPDVHGCACSIPTRAWLLSD